MTTAFLSTAITTLSAIVLKPIITKCLPTNRLGEELAGDAGERLAERLSEHLGEKIGSRFGREQTVRDKLESTVQSVFDQLNAKEKYDGKFSEFPAYVRNNSIIIKNRDDMSQQLRAWRINKQKTSVTTIKEEEINHFVKEFFEELTTQINKDTTLNAYVTTQMTKVNLEQLIKEINQLKKELPNSILPQNDTIINEEVIDMIEKNIQELKNQLKFSDSKIKGKNYTQENKSTSNVATMSNVFEISGGEVDLDSFTQINIASDSGTE